VRARLPALFVLLCAVPQLTWAATYKVTNTQSSGYKSLRWAIQKVNSQPGPDRITFDAALSGQTIRPTAALDMLTDSATTVDGDLDNDGAPDITLDGKLAPGAYGLYIHANNCVVEGLAIVRFGPAGIGVAGCTGCRVRNCHFGVDRTGTTALRNSFSDIWITGGGSHIIGESGARNIFSCGAGMATGSTGVRIVDSSDNKVQFNYVGLDRAGATRVASDGYGVIIQKTSTVAHGNMVRNNVFAGMGYGVEIRGGDENVLQGNLFGLAADGTTNRPISGPAVDLVQSAEKNLIGGTTAAARNVFGAAYAGVALSGTGTSGNRVMGNYFGTNAAGTSQRLLPRGVAVTGGAGSQTIGGATSAAGNCLTAKGRPGDTTFAVYFSGGGSGSAVRNNRIGVRPDGKNALTIGGGVHVQSASVTVTDNLVARCAAGLDPIGTGTVVEAYRNVFRDCGYGALIRSDAACRFGNLRNARSDDDGGNDFRTSNDWAISNYSARNVPAEGNNFHTTVKAEIEARIYDRRDNASYGRVDFIPLAGGVIPTGDTALAGLPVTGAAVMLAAGGAEIVYTLGSPAVVTVTIRNLAGRSVATVVRDQVAGAGLQRAVWSGCADNGLRAPAGVYLVEINARSADGGQARAIARLEYGR
jgi:hypothetical protein